MSGSSRMRSVMPVGLAALALGCGANAENAAVDRGVEGGQTAPENPTPSTTPIAPGAETATPEAVPPPGNPAICSIPARMEDAVVPPNPPPHSPAAECNGNDPSTVEVRKTLKPFEISSDAVARRTLFSWTTPQQIAELRGDTCLLGRVTTTSGERGRFADVMAESVEKHAFAKIISEPRFARTRHAWGNALGTVQGGWGENYGDQLLAITLKEEALIARVIANFTGLAISFFDLAGDVVPDKIALDEPERIGAVYFEDQRQAPCNLGSTLGLQGSAFREYVLPNETMIESFSAFSKETRTQLEQEVAAIEAMQEMMFYLECLLSPAPTECFPADVLADWNFQSPSTPPAVPEPSQRRLLRTYRRLLAFPDLAYLPSAGRLRELRDKLASVPQDLPELRRSYAP